MRVRATSISSPICRPPIECRQDWSLPRSTCRGRRPWRSPALLLSEVQWQAFLKKGSADLARTIEGVRCRINILETLRGVGLAIRLLSSIVPTIETINLHPSLKDLCEIVNGLVLVSGPTGSGKSTTLAAFVEEINQASSRHIITLEYPIEFEYQPHKSFIRQREIGRDTPSMQQGLLDTLREDPDVVVVGEMRDPETMRLTLNAAETGHLVFATMHSGTCIEALADRLGVPVGDTVLGRGPAR